MIESQFVGSIARNLCLDQCYLNLYLLLGTNGTSRDIVAVVQAMHN